MLQYMKLSWVSHCIYTGFDKVCPPVWNINVKTSVKLLSLCVFVRHFSYNSADMSYNTASTQCSYFSWTTGSIKCYCKPLCSFSCLFLNISKYILLNVARKICRAYFLYEPSPYLTLKHAHFNMFTILEHSRLNSDQIQINVLIH